MHMDNDTAGRHIPLVNVSYECSWMLIVYFIYFNMFCDITHWSRYFSFENMIILLINKGLVDKKNEFSYLGESQWLALVELKLARKINCLHVDVVYIKNPTGNI